MKKRTIIGIFLTIIIIAGIVFVYINKDEYFTNEVLITYGDGCVEKYIDAVLVGNKCDSNNSGIDFDILP